MSGFIYSKGGLSALAIEVLEGVFTSLGALAAFDVLRRWRWARIAGEILGSILVAGSAMALLFSEVVVGQRIAVFAPAALFTLYSLTVALFVSYESRAASGEGSSGKD